MEAEFREAVGKHDFEKIGKLFDLLATLVLFPVVAQRLFDHLAGRTRADQMVTPMIYNNLKKQEVWITMN